jgi:hypothetical protein
MALKTYNPSDHIVVMCGIRVTGFAENMIKIEYNQDAVTLKVDAHVDLISAFAKRIGKLVTNTGDEKADLLTQVGGYVIRDLQHKLDVVDRTLTLKLDKQQLTIPLPKQFNSGAPSRTIDEDAPHPNDAIERISTRPRPGGR